MTSLTLSLPASGVRAATPRLRGKRVLDIVLSTLILLAIWPLLLGLALVVRATSPGPALFLQTRVGRNGRTFRIMKFRSMYLDAERRRAAVAALSDREGICVKIRKDPRVTPVGRVIRRWSLDELPQLFNVLRGEMSLVGPRPALLEEVAAYPAQAHRRHAVPPGITGLWQVSGRADIGFAEMIALDLAYVERTSPWLDVAILFRTAGAVLQGKGAY
jgi:lipopolysaccharide/colanic/teichoic acid biosynthesis glycosyltransferase